MKLDPTRKPKHLRKAERLVRGIPWLLTPRNADWHTDSTKAERVQLCHLQKGERFRFLNEYGKPYGPRWTVVFDMDDYEEKYGYKTGWYGKYYPWCSMMFRKEGDDQNYHVQHKDQVIVKPCHGAAMAVLAKLNSLTHYNYFPA